MIRWASVHESPSSDTQGKEPLTPLQRALQLDGGAGGALIVARARAHSMYSWVNVRVVPTLWADRRSVSVVLQRVQGDQPISSWEVTRDMLILILTSKRRRRTF